MKKYLILIFTSVCLFSCMPELLENEKEANNKEDVNSFVLPSNIDVSSKIEFINPETGELIKESITLEVIGQYQDKVFDASGSKEIFVTDGRASIGFDSSLFDTAENVKVNVLAKSANFEDANEVIVFNKTENNQYKRSEILLVPNSFGAISEEEFNEEDTIILNPAEGLVLSNGKVVTNKNSPFAKKYYDKDKVDLFKENSQYQNIIVVEPNSIKIVYNDKDGNEVDITSYFDVGARFYKYPLYFFSSTTVKYDDDHPYYGNWDYDSNRSVYDYTKPNSRLTSSKITFGADWKEELPDGVNVSDLTDLIQLKVVKPIHSYSAYSSEFINPATGKSLSEGENFKQYNDEDITLLKGSASGVFSEEALYFKQELVPNTYVRELKVIEGELKDTNDKVLKITKSFDDFKSRSFVTGVYDNFNGYEMCDYNSRQSFALANNVANANQGVLITFFKPDTNKIVKRFKGLFNNEGVFTVYKGRNAVTNSGNYDIRVDKYKELRDINYWGVELNEDLEYVNTFENVEFVCDESNTVVTKEVSLSPSLNPISFIQLDFRCKCTGVPENEVASLLSNVVVESVQDLDGNEVRNLLYPDPAGEIVTGVIAAENIFTKFIVNIGDETITKSSRLYDGSSPSDPIPVNFVMPTTYCNDIKEKTVLEVN